MRVKWEEGLSEWQHICLSYIQASVFLLHCSPSVVHENNTYFYLPLCSLITPQRSINLFNQVDLKKKKMLVHKIWKIKHYSSGIHILPDKACITSFFSVIHVLCYQTNFLHIDCGQHVYCLLLVSAVSKFLRPADRL